MGALIANQWRSQPKTECELTGAVVLELAERIQTDLLNEFEEDLRRFGLKIWNRVCS